MKFWLAFPLFALAQASCYDYEYYDPVTQASIPGNACAQQAAAAAGGVAQPIGQPIAAAPSFATTTTTQFGQPAVYGSTASLPTYSTTTTLPTYTSAPVYSAPVSTTTYTSAPVYSSAPVVTSYPVVSSYPATTVYSAAPLAPTYAAVAQPTVYASTATRLPVSTTYVAPPVAVATTVRAASPVVTTAPRSAAQSSQAAELQYYKDLGERQQRQHKQNQRIVKDASQDLTKLSLVNRIVAGAGNAAPWYPIARLSNQKEVAEAYRSEKQIAAKNAEDAYQRYLKDPSHLNLLVSKYQDLNADLRAAAHQYNVINAGTFGQNIAANALGLGGSLTISRLITSRQQSDDLEDIQRQMQRIARQIQAEAQTRLAAAKGGSPQGSVQQRLLGVSQASYGPQPQRG